MSTGQPDLDATTNAYYVSLGDDVYRPTLHAQGAWRVDEQHVGAATGLLAHVLETHEPRPDCSWRG